MKLLMKSKLENSDLDANLHKSITNELQAKNFEASNLVLHKKIKFASVKIKFLKFRNHLK